MKAAIDIETTGLLSENLHNKVTCIGIKLMDKDPVVFCSDNEKEILENTMKFVHNNPDIEFYGWNVMGFDELFIQFRCMVNKVNIADFSKVRGKTIDLMKLFAGYNPKGFALNKVAIELGLTSNDHDGKECIMFYQLGNFDAIAEKNRIDLVQTEVIMKRCIEIGLIKA